MAVEELSSDWLGEEVRAVETSGDLGDTNLVMLDGLTRVVVPDVDVLGAAVGGNGDRRLLRRIVSSAPRLCQTCIMALFLGGAIIPRMRA
jgi:hypothetical protein